MRNPAPKRAPDSELVLPRRAPCQQQVRDVHAADQQHERHGGQEGQHGRAKTLHAEVTEGRHRPTHIGVFVGVLLLETACNGLHLRPRLGLGHARLEASDREKAVVAAAEIGFGVAHRHPELTRAAPELPLEIPRHHAHHCEIRAVHADGPAHERWIAAVAPLPQSIAEDDLVIPPQRLFFGKESTAEKRLHAQHREEARGHAQARHLLRVLLGACRREVIAPASGIKDRHVFKRVALPLKSRSWARRRCSNCRDPCQRFRTLT